MRSPPFVKCFFSAITVLLFLNSAIAVLLFLNGAIALLLFMIECDRGLALSDAKNRLL